jgi:hypothetical protein
MTGILIFIACLSQGPVDTAAPDELAAQVRRLVRRLDSDELSQREAAEKGLIDLGAAALEHLPQPSPRISAETRQRLTRIRSILQQVAANASVEPGLLTLRGDDLPLDEVLAAIEKQTGNRLVDFRERFGQQRREVRVDADFDKTPFWAALDSILDESQLTLYNFPGEKNVLAYVARSPGELPRRARASYAGIFRIEATQIDAVRNLRTPGDDALKLTMEVVWEPRTSPISLAMPLSEIKAVDDTGQEISVDGLEGSLEANVQSGVAAVEIDVPLRLPDRSVKRIASLTGKMTALVPGAMETFEFSDLPDAKDVSKRKAGVTVVLQTVRKNLEVHEVRILVRFDEAANALESHRGWIEENPAYLLDANGKRIEPSAYEQTSRARNEVGLAYLFSLEDGPAGHTFVYKTPAAIVKMPIEYKLKDIALP